MGPTIANSACTTLAASYSNQVASFVGTLTNYKICNVVSNTPNPLRNNPPNLLPD
jgi:hypothetical protein